MVHTYINGTHLLLIWGGGGEVSRAVRSESSLLDSSQIYRAGVLNNVLMPEIIIARRIQGYEFRIE